MRDTDLDEYKSNYWLAHDIGDFFHFHGPASYLKDQVLGMLFLKRLSDVFDEELERAQENRLRYEKPSLAPKRMVPGRQQHDGAIFIPERARWANLSVLKDRVAEQIHEACCEIESFNSSLKGLLVQAKFHYLKDKDAQDLVSLFSKYRLRNEDFESSSSLRDLYNYLIEGFSDPASRQYGASSFQKSEVERLLGLQDEEA